MVTEFDGLPERFWEHCDGARVVSGAEFFYLMFSLRPPELGGPIVQRRGFRADEAGKQTVSRRGLSL